MSESCLAASLSLPVEDDEGGGAGAVEGGGQEEDDPPGARRRQAVARDGLDHRRHQEAGRAVRQGPPHPVQRPGVVGSDVLHGRDRRSISVIHVQGFRVK